MRMLLRTVLVLGIAASLIGCDQQVKPQSGDLQEGRDPPELSANVNPADSKKPSEDGFVETALDRITIPASAREESTKR